MPKLASIEEVVRSRKQILSKRDPNRPCVIISSGTCGRANRSEEVIAKLKKEIERQKSDGKFDIRVTGCLGFCEREPIMVINPPGIFYPSVSPNDVPEIVRETLINGKTMDRLLYVDPVTGKKCTYQHEIPFYQKQEPIVFGDNSKIDPLNIQDYIAIGGYSALARVLSEMTPKEIIEVVKASGLRGRGGGGFPTGIKWESCRKTHEDIKYVLCNADEGDPGAYMDRSLLEGCMIHRLPPS